MVASSTYPREDPVMEFIEDDDGTISEKPSLKHLDFCETLSEFIAHISVL